MAKYIFLILITFSEATIGVFVKLVGDNVPIFSLNFYRILFAFLLVLSIIPFIDKNFWKLSRDNIKPVLIIGGLIALQISLFNYAMSLAPIANVMIFWSVAPFFVFLFSAFFLKEKVRKQHILIFLIAFIGLIIAKPLSGGYVLGNVIALFDGAVYAALITYMRYERKTDNANLLFWYLLIAVIYLLPGIIIFGPGQITKFIHYPNLGIDLPIILWVVCLGVVSTGIAYTFINLVLKKINAAIYALVDIIFSPIVAAFFGYLIFNEMPSRNMAIGAVFLLISGFILTTYMYNHHKHLASLKAKTLKTQTKITEKKNIR